MQKKNTKTEGTSTLDRLRHLLARLDASPLPPSDPVRSSLEWELLGRLERAIVLETARRGRLFGATAPRGEA